MRTVTLREVLKPRSEIVHPRDRPTGNATFVGLEHIESGSGRRIGSTQIRLEDLTGRKARFYPGDIVYGYLRPYLNKVWLADIEGYCSVDQYVFQVRPGEDPGYISMFMRSSRFLMHAPKSQTPGQLPRIRTDEVLSVPIDLPNLEIQRQVNHRLTVKMATVERLREGHGGAAYAVERMRVRVYEDAFGAEIPFDVRPGRSMPMAGWRWVPLIEVARLESGHTPSRSHPEWWGGDIPWLALPDIRAVDGRTVTETVEHTNADGIANSAARVLPAGTVALSRTASVGFVTKFGRPMATSQDFVNWVCGPGLDPDFLLHLLIRSRAAIRALASGATHKTVYYPTVKSFQVCIPDVDEQRRIVAMLEARLRSVNEIGSMLDAQRRATDSLPAAILREAFAGVE
jgi:type I restriction enzyme S subunit